MMKQIKYYLKRYYTYTIICSLILFSYFHLAIYMKFINFIFHQFQYNLEKIHISKPKYVQINFIIESLNLPDSKVGILDIDLTKAKQSIEKHTFIKNVSIYRNIAKGAICIYLTERNPIGIYQQNDKRFFIDDKGLIIQPYIEHLNFYKLPSIKGKNAIKYLAKIKLHLNEHDFNQITQIEDKNNKITVKIKNFKQEIISIPLNANLSIEENCEILIKKISYNSV